MADGNMQIFLAGKQCFDISDANLRFERKTELNAPFRDIPGVWFMPLACCPARSLAALGHRFYPCPLPQERNTAPRCLGAILGPSM